MKLMISLILPLPGGLSVPEALVPWAQAFTLQSCRQRGVSQSGAALPTSAARNCYPEICWATPYSSQSRQDSPKSRYSTCLGSSGLFSRYGGISPEGEVKRIIHTWEQHFFFFSARCNCISLVLLKLSKHRHLKISWAAPCLHMEPMLDTDPRTSK